MGLELSSGKDKSDQFAKYAEAVAKDLFGEPNKHLSSAKELRFGNNGSMSVVLETGQFYDHESSEGGGVLWAIEQATGKSIEGGHAVEWMRDNGYYIDDGRDAPPSGGYSGGANWTPPGIPDHAKLTKAYDYVDASGTLRYQVVRYDWEDPDNPKGHSKEFRQRHPDKSKKHGWSWKVKGIEPLPYMLPELVEAVAQDLVIFVVEGEKAADRLNELGVPATTNSGGAGKFPEAIVPFFKGARVVILPDNDPQAKNKDGSLKFTEDGRPYFTGQEHALLVGNKIIDVAKSVKILDLPGLGPKDDVVEWLDAGGTPEQLYDLVEKQAKPFEPTPYQSRFGAVLWQDLDAPGKSYEYLIKDVLTRGEMSMTAGASGSGKTFLIVDMAMCVARGVPFFGHRVRQGGVIYQAGEGATGLRRKRLRAYREHYQCADEPVPFVLLESPIDLYSGDDQTAAFIDEINYWSRKLTSPLELVVIDTFSKATPGINENDSADIGRVLERCDQIRKATGAHVKLVHHMNAEGAKPRGHTSMLANIETVIITRQLEDQHDRDGRKIREWELKKQKEGEAGTKFKFVLPQIQIGTDEDGDKITSCIIAPPSGAEGQPLPTAGITVGGQSQVVLRAIYNALEEHGVTPFPGLKDIPSGGRIVDSGFVREELKKVLSDDAEPAPAEETEEEAEARKKRNSDARRQALTRARQMLYTKKIIGIQDNWIWLTGKKVKGFGPPPGVAAAKRRQEKEKEEIPHEKIENDPLGPDLPF